MAAGPGTRILVRGGTYHGTVRIEGAGKNGLQIIGNGARLVGDHGASFTGDPMACMLGVEPLCPERAGFFLRDVSGVTIRGFTVTDFGLGAESCMGEGFLLVDAHHNRIEHNTMTRSDMMGITLVRSGHNAVEHNLIYENDVERPGQCGFGCGLHVAGSGSVNNVIRKNVVWGNPFSGIMLRFAGAGNQIVENVFQSGARWGITNRATSGTVIAANVVSNHTGFQINSPVGIGDGIDVAGSSNVTVTNNRAHNNSRFDVFWDGGGSGNTFTDNRCGTSNQAGLCGS